ncbi:CheR family methyltransferase [Endothiovibrio diazotrophicus]
MNEAERIEMELLLRAIYRRYGYDFRNYAEASLVRRLRQAQASERAENFSALTHALLHDPAVFDRVLNQISINVTEMFRDPDFYRVVREQLVPALRAQEHFKVWHAGCATGEEVYSMAILLREEGLYPRAQIYATDLDPTALHRAREGVYPIDKIKLYTANYQRAGGQRSFSDYYHADDRFAVLDSKLRENVLFADHNLVTDGVFGEMQVIFCRNVMIYFDRELQNQVLRLFHDSLSPGGFLCLGEKESVRYSLVSERFEDVDKRRRIYRKRGEE